MCYVQSLRDQRPAAASAMPSCAASPTTESQEGCKNARPILTLFLGRYTQLVAGEFHLVAALELQLGEEESVQDPGNPNKGLNPELPRSPD